MIDFFLTCEQSLDSSDKISTNNTTDTTIAYLYEFFSGFYYQLCIDTFTTKFIFDNRYFIAMISSGYMVEEGGLSTSEKSGKYGDRYRHNG